MKKKIWWIIGTSFIVIISVAFIFFSHSITANIPSKSSYAPTFKDWTIHFSEKMNPDTFTSKTVTVMNNNNEQVDVSFEWNEDNTVLTLQAPNDGYNIDHTYMITVSADVETTAGSQLDNTFTHSFTAVAKIPNIKDNEQLMTLLKERMEQRKEMTVQQNDSSTEESSSGDAAMDTASSGEEASTTNVQVDGIDEGDIIKTDGEFVYFARESDVVITTANNDNSNVLSTISEENFRPAEIYLHKDNLIMIGHKSKPIREQQSAKSSSIESFPLHRAQTSVLIYDVSDKSNPKQVREVSFEGSLTASRLMDGHMYLIANQHPPYRILEEDATDTDVRPFIKDTAVSNEVRPLDFDSMYFFPESEDENFLLLGSIDLDNMDKEIAMESYLGASNQMYMSKKNIYIAVNKYNYQDEKDENDAGKNTTDIAIARPPANTEINQFKIDSGKITYNASTIVNGTLINQFAMDERNKTFRVATTKGDMWNEKEPSTNNLYTFDLQMNPIGKLEGLAKDERIYSVRFMDEVAYMVTFKQVDPLFVIDLKNPEKPAVLGKLKIPGFSNYLHPLDDNHVIGFGQNTKLVETEDGREPRVRINGLKISVFDVSDPTEPKEKYSEIIGQGHSYTELNHNHNALYKHPEDNIFGFPATLFETKTVHKGDATYEEQSLVYEGAFLYNITPENGINVKDTITHQQEIKQMQHPKWESEVKRMVSVGDTLYTFSLSQMKVYDMSEEYVTQTVELPELKERY
ncbi:beta-propeller domain-containing protein [Virgibacillus litoralis]|uniref:Secreted protein with C-terminal beta-propeller domain n=1 Tax=Virgibacillus litoralis TaxID=578221 RepID=A0ABS4H8P6_9BACI|nr:beta-propeller domain-containing protein [Virgibacillus litoralis]MBP1947273.1 putative secreted protein with C-terminal beta-propeller domain [Virgibacillus litoralis]